MAFLGDSTDHAQTYTRIFLVTKGQLEDIVAQENGIKPGLVTIDLGRLINEGRVDLPLDKGKYRRVMVCGKEDNLPILTCTTDDPFLSGSLTAPRADYLRWMARGLSEKWGLSTVAATTYLLSIPGVNLGYQTVEQLSNALHV